MADIRVTYSPRSREPGTTVGVQVNTFALQKLLDAVTGESIATAILETMSPIKDEAYTNWPKDTGASADSIVLFVSEVNPRSARVILQAGGKALIEDERNRSHKDYAPYIEFGTYNHPARGVLRDAVYDNDSLIRSGLHDAIAALVQEALK